MIMVACFEQKRHSKRYQMCCFAGWKTGGNDFEERIGFWEVIRGLSYQTSNCSPLFKKKLELIQNL